MIQPSRFIADINSALLGAVSQRSATPRLNPHLDAQNDNKLHQQDGFDRNSRSGAMSQNSRGLHLPKRALGAGGFQASAGLAIAERNVDWEKGGLMGTNKGFVDVKAERKAEAKWSNRPEEKKAEASGLPMEMTLFNVGARRDLTAAQADVTGKVAGADLQASIYAARLTGSTGLKSTVDLKSGTVKADANFRVGAHAAGVEVSGSRGFGGKTVNTKTSAIGKAYVGAEAGAKGAVAFEPRKGNVGVSAGLDAFAGAKANGMIKQSFGAAGENLGSAAVKGEAWAGVGVSADAEAGFQDGKFKIGASVGAALGVGGKIGFAVEVDVVGTAKAIGRGAEAVADGVSAAADAAMDTAVEVGQDLANAVSSGWDAVSKLW